MRMAVKQSEQRDSATPYLSGITSVAATITPRASTDAAIHHSTPGIGTPSSANPPPASIAAMNVQGMIQIALPPIRTASKPTAIIARR